MLLRRDTAEPWQTKRVVRVATTTHAVYTYTDTDTDTSTHIVLGQFNCKQRSSKTGSGTTATTTTKRLRINTRQAGRTRTLFAESRCRSANRMDDGRPSHSMGANGRRIARRGAVYCVRVHKDRSPLPSRQRRRSSSSHA